MRSWFRIYVNETVVKRIIEKEFNWAGTIKSYRATGTHQFCEESILLDFVMDILEELKVALNIWKEVNISLNDHRQFGI